MHVPTSNIPADRPRGGRIALWSLWSARAVVAAVFIAAGLVTLSAPMDYLAAHLPWTGQFSAAFVRSIGLIDLAGGLSMVLPWPRRFGPGPTLAAALGCAALQACSVVLHLVRAEPQFLPLNLVLLLLCLYVARVLWPTRSTAPIAEPTP